MNRIDALFGDLRARGRKALVGYLTAGDPDLEASERDIRAALAAGLDVLELGVPFSDPTADGPVIQAASHRALAAGTNLDAVFALVRRLRRDCTAPIVLFGYANPLFRRGYERACAEAAACGADGLLVVDLPHEMAGELESHAARQGLCRIPLIAPTTPTARAREILTGARGFVYYIMVRGVTGARDGVAEDLGRRVAELRSVTALPIAAGFGVAARAQAEAVARVADAVVAGSALVAAAREGRLTERVMELKAGVDAAGDAAR